MTQQPWFVDAQQDPLGKATPERSRNSPSSPTTENSVYIAATEELVWTKEDPWTFARRSSMPGMTELVGEALAGSVTIPRGDTPGVATGPAIKFPFPGSPPDSLKLTHRLVHPHVSITSPGLLMAVWDHLHAVFAGSTVGLRSDTAATNALRLRIRNLTGPGYVLPSEWVRQKAEEMIDAAHAAGGLPSRVAPIADGGIALVFEPRTVRRARIDITNDEDVVVTKRFGPSEPPSYEDVPPEKAVEVVVNFLSIR